MDIGEPVDLRKVVVDGRLRASAATGVASYGRAMIEALTAAGRAPLILDDMTRGRFGEGGGRWAAARRRMRAAFPAAVPLSPADDGEGLFGRDLFRLAQVRFTVSGRLLDLRAPGQPGIMHWTYPIPARIAGWINLYTVHDVIPLQRPGLSPIDPAGLRARLLAIAARADRIVAVSRAGRESIIGALDLPPAMVTDCGSGVAAMTGGGGALPVELPTDGYFLFCGLVEPRKNLSRLVHAWSAGGRGRPLVIVGPDGDEGAALRRALLARPGVIVLPYQPRATLVDLIAGARALLFPTLEEGFGLPVAEAMTLGTAVLTSDRGALAETAGGAALLVDPESTRAMAGAIARLDADDVLVGQLRASGRERAVLFSPAAFGARLVALHAEFAGASPSPD